MCGLLVVALWLVVCFTIGLLWPVAVGAHVLCFCLLPAGKHVACGHVTCGF
jgi:hypothetical protein